MNGYSLTPREFKKFRDIIYYKTGVNLGEQKRDLVLSRLTKRLRILNIKTFEEYYHYISHDGNSSEITAMINRITTNVTSFFRENHHFHVLRDIVIPQLMEKGAASGRRKVRIWSAGCSTGQEPYSIAITLADAFRGHVGWDIKILATDLDTEVLSKGENGVYSKEVVDKVPQEQMRRFFKKGLGENKGLYQVTSNIRDMVVFRQLNLTMERFPIRGPLDAIFCRNVIIYFDKKMKEKLIRTFNGLLGNNGYLFMGHSESLIAMKEEFNYIHNTVYQKNI